MSVIGCDEHRAIAAEIERRAGTMQQMTIPPRGS